MSGTAVASFSLTEPNRHYVKKFKNQSAYINKLIEKDRLEEEKQQLLDGYNTMAASEDEMNEWVEIANDSENLKLVA